MQPDETWPADGLVRDYVPCGRFDPTRLAPLLVVGVVASLAMATALLPAEGSVFHILGPLLFAAVISTMTWTVVDRGRCRDERLAILVGASFGLAFNVGLWEMSYRANVASLGPAKIAAVEAFAGLPGLPGYVLYCCRTKWPEEGPMLPPRRLEAADVATKVAGCAIQLLGTFVLPMRVGRSAALRVYSGRLERWASSIETRLPTSVAGEAFDAVDRGDWDAFGTLPRMVCKDFTPAVLVRIEHFPGEPEEPWYVTVRPTWVGGRPWIDRRRIPPDQAGDLARVFPALRASAEEAESRDRRAAGPDAARAGDFRDDAVAASRLLVGDPPPTELTEASTSLCLPASDDPLGEMRRMGRHIRTIHVALAAIPCLGLGLASAGLILVGLDEPSGLVVAGLGGMGLFWIGPPIAIFWARGPRSWRASLIRRLRERPGSPIGRRPRLPHAVLVLQDGEAERAGSPATTLGSPSSTASAGSSSSKVCLIAM